MAHYALINSDNIVVQVITGIDENIIQTDTDGTVVGGSSEAWENFYSSLPWFAGLYCKRTSYNNNIRKQYAGIGFTYDTNADVFVAPQPYPSWIKNSDTYLWEAPTAMPVEEGKRFTWDEPTLSWVEVE